MSNSQRHAQADQIEIDIAKQGEECQIRFSDNGSGIPDEIKKHVFDEGFHYGDSGHTGLGLHIVKSLIDSYKGKISIENNQPQGTVFIISLACKST
ncbi:MAG: ATP-binding protein [Candidatus Cloacimonetes bacterium]|nr:ATP-binding protein [Candidatus Cloacimonadota bacterium]